MHLLNSYKYHLLFGFSIIWMVFIDSNNFLYRFKLNQEVNNLETSIQLHKKSIRVLELNYKSLTGNEKALETFARETYLLKKADEDLYLIIPANTAVKVKNK